MDRECAACGRRYTSPSDTLADLRLCKACQNGGVSPPPVETEEEADADRFQTAVQNLAAAIHTALRLRHNLADPRPRRPVQEAYDAYCDVIRDLYGSERP